MWALACAFEGNQFQTAIAQSLAQSILIGVETPRQFGTVTTQLNPDCRAREIDSGLYCISLIETQGEFCSPPPLYIDGFLILALTVNNQGH